MSLYTLLSLPNEHPKKTVFIATSLCLVCSILVAFTSVNLRPLQIANQQLDIKKNILAVAGKLHHDTDVDRAFEQFEAKVVDLHSGQYIDIDPQQYDQYQAAKDPEQRITLSAQQDIANIRVKPKWATVYLLKNNHLVEQIILPVSGYGLWSTLYGFIALDADLSTIGGLRFYQHAETPGLGGEIDNPLWREKWQGKQAFDSEGQLKIKVMRGAVPTNAKEYSHQVDGISGATLTSQGVSNLVRFWLGQDGFGPYLSQLRSDDGAL
ncbi:MAG TPA: Na(+)-translocating NADH-quinone reductase subunit C [Gammaproteobacteria bacterium]|nr:Na(+)-translocating NADH-quinone reductase subunit C [Gammaproteobacteria bacterium]